jgi:hypothetical protein
MYITRNEAEVTLGCAAEFEATIDELNRGTPTAAWLSGHNAAAIVRQSGPLHTHLALDRPRRIPRLVS